MNLLRFIGLALVAQLVTSSPQGTASIEGVVVKLGTTDVVVDADVELSRVEGVVEAPMTDAATAFFKTVLDGFGPSGAFPPAVIANEVQYAKSDANGRFSFRNLKPNTAEQPLTITVGSTPGTLQGRVADNQGRPAVATWVALIPEGPLRFRTAHKFASSDAAGRFQIGNVPPGNYRAYAWMDAEKDDWQDPAFVERYAALGTPVQLGEGATVTLELIAR